MKRVNDRVVFGTVRTSHLDPRSSPFPRNKVTQKLRSGYLLKMMSTHVVFLHRQISSAIFQSRRHFDNGINIAVLSAKPYPLDKSLARQTNHPRILLFAPPFDLLFLTEK